MNQALKTAIDNQGIVTFTLNRPEKHNALSADLIALFLEALENIKRSSTPRILILSAAGDTFCSGGDLKQMIAADDLYSAQLGNLMRELYLADIPTIARIHAPVFGGGVGLITCCDFAIASKNSFLALTELKLGLVPATISPYLISAVGPRRAKQMILSGEKITAEQALQADLLSKVVDSSHLDAEINRLCANLLYAGPQALRRTKKLVNELIDFDRVKEVDTANLLTEIRKTDEAKDGINAFFEKRFPKWVKPNG